MIFFFTGAFAALGFEALGFEALGFAALGFAAFAAFLGRFLRGAASKSESDARKSSSDSSESAAFFGFRAAGFLSASESSSRYTHFTIIFS